ncbi:endonuclease MutS2 [uncultured Dialister sp.]|uniref:endonuclease MutS2 n=1 Tax=uncultured Dialister sp. TaxID=278064 RepID=UPI002630B4C0|nr:endonuclease MutS2 [uncultured Dialister sp.]
MEKDILEILEFNEIRKKLADLAPSALSKKMALELTPSSVSEVVEKSLQETEEASILLEREITTPLGETHDILDTLKKAEKGSLLSAKECMDLSNSLDTYKKMHHYFEGERHLQYPALEEISSLLVPQETLISRIHQIFDEHGEVKDQASLKLFRIRTQKETVKSRIRRAFRHILEDKDQASYLQDAIITQRNGRYVVPVKEEYRYKFSGIVHDRSSTGQTLFMEPMVSVELNNDLAEMTAAEKQEIREILEGLTEEIKKTADVTRNNCRLATDMEFIFAKARLALAMKGVKALHSERGVLDLRKARHPLIPEDRVVPVSMTLGKTFRILIITGSNAGGKTIAIKTAGLLALMNQSGLFIPAEEGSMLPVYDHIYAIIGDEQSIQDNLSTFSSYITQLVSFLPSAGEKDLVLLDELGSGTDPVEGAALAQSVTEYLQMKGAPAIITSHFSEMKKLAYETKGIENAFVEFDEKTLAPTYRLIIGVAGNSNAFNICRRFGMPDVILGRAIQLKNESPLHNMEEVMERLNSQSRDMNREKEEVDKTLRQAEELKNSLENARDEFYRRKDSILEKAREEAETMKRDLRVQSEAIIKDLKKNAAAMSRNKLGDKISDIRGKIDSLNVPGKENRREKLPKDQVKKGTWVYIDTIDSEGTIVSVSRNQVQVQCGLIQVKVTADHLFKAKKPKKQEKILPYARKKTMTRSVAAVHTELNIIGKTVDEAIPEVDRFLNECFMAGISPVRIIHGKGTGSLRRGVQDYLRTLNFVTEFHEADPTNGGAGVTEVYF